MRAFGIAGLSVMCMENPGILLTLFLVTICTRALIVLELDVLKMGAMNRKLKSPKNASKFINHPLPAPGGPSVKIPKSWFRWLDIKIQSWLVLRWSEERLYKIPSRNSEILSLTIDSSLIALEKCR